MIAGPGEWPHNPPPQTDGQLHLTSVFFLGLDNHSAGTFVCFYDTQQSRSAAPWLMLISKSRYNSATVLSCQSCSTKKAVAKNHLYSQKPSWSLALSAPTIPLRAIGLSKITKAWVFDWTQYPSWSSCQKVTLDSNSSVSVFNFVFLRLSDSDQLVQRFKSKEPGSPKSEVQRGRRAKQTYVICNQK